MCDLVMRILIDFKKISDGPPATTPLNSKRDRESDGIDEENVPPRKKSKQSETFTVDIDQPSTSMSLEDSSAHCPKHINKPRRTEQNKDVSNDVNNVPSSDIIDIENAVQRGEIIFLSWYIISVGFI